MGWGAFCPTPSYLKGAYVLHLKKRGGGLCWGGVVVRGDVCLFPVLSGQNCCENVKLNLIEFFPYTVNDLFSACNHTLSLCPSKIVGDSPQYPNIFYILYVFLLNKLTFLPCISSLFISTAIFTGSGYF